MCDEDIKFQKICAKEAIPTFRRNFALNTVVEKNVLVINGSLYKLPITMGLLRLVQYGENTRSLNKFQSNTIVTKVP